jgi:hypothetical protein
VSETPNSPEPRSDDPAAGAGKPPGWWAKARAAADIVHSLAIPLLTVAATIIGLYATNSLREREIAIARDNNLQSLRNQREQSETALRSAMFSELVGPLLQTESGQRLSADQADLPRAERLALLAELLTLNFHEHFELGPLLRYVDTLPGQTDEARQRLRSTARRVVSRQLAPLLSTADARAGRNPSFVEVSLNSDLKEPDDALQSCALPDPVPKAGATSFTMNCSSFAQGKPLQFTSPDGVDRLQVNVRAVSWTSQSVGIYAVMLGPKGEPQESTPPIEFTLSPYSFPFSDNTLLPSGNRFGIYLTRIDDIPDVIRVMRLSVVWFPKDFVPPRERPFDLDLSKEGQLGAAN